MKTVIICLHGLIKDAPHDFIPFKEYIEENDIDVDVDLITLYDVKDKKTFSLKRQIKLIEEKLTYYEGLGYNIILVGYSFSCGLCAKMTRKHKISKVVLVSPVTKILTKMGIKYYFSLFFRSFKMKTKSMFNKKKKQRLIKLNSLYIFDLVLSCFKCVGKTNREFKHINCPTLVMFGEYDDISKPKRMCEIRRQVKPNVNFTMNYYKDANHVFIMSKSVDKTVYFNDIIRFVQN